MDCSVNLGFTPESMYALPIPFLFTRIKGFSERIYILWYILDGQVIHRGAP